MMTCRLESYSSFNCEKRWSGDGVRRLTPTYLSRATCIEVMVELG